MATTPGLPSSLRVLGTMAIVAAFVCGALVGRRFGGGESKAAPAQTVEANAAKAVIPPGVQAVGFLDVVDGKPVIHASAGADIRVSGWAACVDAGSPLKSVDVLIDKQVKGHASIGRLRRDVADAYGRPDFKMSGWTSAVSLGEIGMGVHELTGRAVCARGESGTLPPFQLLVEGGQAH